MHDYETVIGLEVHAQLKTASKIFCSCSTQFGEEPNTNICPVCTGMPGTLPVLNARAVEFAVKMALAVGCRVNTHSLFARKNYFYPDLPMGYQISQYDQPLAEHGYVDIHTDAGLKRVGITRIHMENDAGKLLHTGLGFSQVDLNRAGTPLIEIVSEPDMRSPVEAVAYLKALRSILVYLDICDGNMEEGSFRCDANVSLRPRGATTFGTRTELKNMNSFRNVERAIEYEVRRQRELLEDGEAVVQETRLFDATQGVTRSMRGKEEAHDYRYFPDPDLVPLVLSAEQIAQWQSQLPELPAQRRQRFIHDLGLTEDQAEVLTAEKSVADYFEATLGHGVEARKMAHWVMGDVLRELNDRGVGLEACRLAPSELAELALLVEKGTINAAQAKAVFREVFDSGEAPQKVVERRGLMQVSDTSALEAWVRQVLDAHPQEVARLRAGEKKLMGFFVGQVMRLSGGKANPGKVNELISRLV
jgi:aspartyl-tRNA(Asn)/glutamyl-tRNA(Gln) amidotransferase subunit B